MGFILDAMGAAAGAGGEMLGEQRKSAAELEQRRTLASDQEAMQGRQSVDLEARQKRLAEFNSQMDEKGRAAAQALRLQSIPQEERAKADAEDSTRQRRANELDTATKGLIGDKMATPEEMAAARKEAGIKTGQLSLKDAMGDDAKGATRALQAELGQARLDAQNAKTDATLQAAMARVEVLQAKVAAGGSRGSGNMGREDRLRYTAPFLEASRRLTEAQKALTKIMPGKMGEAERASLNLDIAQYKEERSMYQSLLADSQAATPDNKKPAASATPSKAPAPVSELPKGAKQVGTSGGKPVFETPDGKRFIGK